MSAQPFRSSIARFHKGPPLPCHVLIVDDDELNLIRISALLERSGYQVSVARSGKDALRVAARLRAALADSPIATSSGPIVLTSVSA